MQPLVVTAGWRVAYHQFFAIEPTREFVESEELWFKEDLYQARHDRRDRLIDLGWYPEQRFEDGSFRLVLFEGDFRGRLIADVCSKNPGEIVGTMNRWFFMVSEGLM